MVNLKNVFFIPLFLFFVNIETNAQKNFTLTDYAKLVNLADPQISPDGKKIVLVTSRPDYDLNLFSTELVVVDVATGENKIIFSSRPSISFPRWSPDGSSIAFLAKESSDKAAVLQIFIISLHLDSARQLTHAKKGVQHFSWSPSAAKIAFVSADDAVNKGKIEKGFTAFEVGNNDMFLGAQPAASHIWLYDMTTGKESRLTSGEWSLPVTIPPGAPSSPISWSPDEKNILFVKVPSVYSGESPLKIIQVLDLSTLEIHALTSHQKFEAYPAYSSDGKSILYWYKKDANSEDINDIRIFDVTAKTDRSVSSKLDRDLYRSSWMPDGKSFIAGGHDDNKTSLWKISTEGIFQKIDLGKVCPAWSFWVDLSISSKGEIAFIGSEPDHPAELYYLASSSSIPRRLTAFNAETGSMRFGKTETIRWETDGWQHNGIVTYPVNFDTTKKYPLVLIIHGGPASTSVEQFSRLSQVFSNEDYFVFEPNYRGSDNLGSSYKLAIVGDAAPGPGRDVMDGIKKLKQLVPIDAGRVAVTGWSYGGFMTVWLAGHYAGWAAAMAGAAVTDLADQYNLSDYNINRATAMGGSPWVGNNMKKYIDQSPITEARNIKAPTLILANTGDPRVPINQSYKLFHALKDNGTITRFIAWPINAHNASDPVTQMERDRNWISWINKYLKK